MATQPLRSGDISSAPAGASPPMDVATKAALAILVALGVALRVWLCFHDDGIYWPDEIYQSLEPAHRLVFGYGLIPWEFAEGARNWAFPGLVAALLRVAAFAGGDQPRHYLVAIRLAFSAVGMVTAWGTYRLARACGSQRIGAAIGALFFVLAPPAIYFAPRALSETASAAAVVFGFAWVFGADDRRRDVLVGASLLGFSALLRIQNGIFCVGLISILLARRRWTQAGLSAVVLLVWAVVYGVLDWLTWGDWFHSAVAYLRFNIVEGKAAQWGVSENTYYLRVLWTSMPLIAVFAAPLALLGAGRSPGLFGVVLVYLVLHSVVGHKELRFVLPILPVWFALAGAGLSWLAVRFRFDARWLAAPVAACAAIAAARFHELTFGDVGQYEHERPTVSAYDDFGPVNRLLLAAHDQPDLCGIEVEAAHLAWTGGATYLHRNVPIFSRGTWMGAGHYNYVITFGRPVEMGRIVATEGPLALVRLPRSTCVPDPTYRWKLP
jgi:phosphatidylinositol glycan class B